MRCNRMHESAGEGRDTLRCDAPAREAKPPDNATGDAARSGERDRWRAIERMLNTVQPGSQESEALMAEFERIRNEYSRALRAQRDDRG